MTRLLALVLVVSLFTAITQAAVRAHHRAAAEVLVLPSAAGVVGEPSSSPLATRTRSPRLAHRPHHPRHLAAVTTRLLDVTSYCETGNRTASGVWPRYGMAASNLFPFGTRLRVPGWPVVVTITDRIGWGSQLDLFSPSCRGAVQWGRRSLLVEVLP